MYADRVEVAGKASVKERLNANSASDANRRRLVTAKRQRQDDKWEHDLYKANQPRVSDPKVGLRDLRLKLQRKSNQSTSQGPKVRDLRERLSGTVNSQPVNVDPPKPKLNATKRARKNIAVEANESDIKTASRVAPPKKIQQKADTSVDDFLESLGLEKYLITFQAEEVDMTALVHMTDSDLKALGIPMGPRKKIILTLESRG